MCRLFILTYGKTSGCQALHYCCLFHLQYCACRYPESSRTSHFSLVNRTAQQVSDSILVLAFAKRDVFFRTPSLLRVHLINPTLTTRLQPTPEHDSGHCLSSTHKATQHHSHFIGCKCLQKVALVVYALSFHCQGCWPRLKGDLIC